jgi:hypothetical protein
VYQIVAPPETYPIQLSALKLFARRCLNKLAVYDRYDDKCPKEAREVDLCVCVLQSALIHVDETFESIRST